MQVLNNFLNLPITIKQGSTVKATYTYLADGTKIKAVNALGVGFDYIGSFKYNRSNSNITLESVATAGGRTYKTSSGYEARYFVTDHLGSTRLVTNSSGTVLEQNDYMPYGERHSNSALAASSNQYLYNGKESQKDFGINYIDSEARFQRLDGAFNSIDPKAEENYWISPYTYCNANPIRYIDQTGELTDDYFNYFGKYLGNDGTASNNIRIVSDDVWNKYATDKLSILTNVFTRSVLFSQAPITYDAAFNVISHYNITDFSVLPQIGKFDMRANIEYIEYKYNNTIKVELGDIKLEVNSKYIKDLGIYDNYYNLISSFEHESQHIIDAITSPSINYKKSHKEKELNAIEFQKASPTYLKTTPGYREKVNRYEQEIMKLPN